MIASRNPNTMDIEAPTNKMLWSVREAARAMGISERALWSITQPRGDMTCVRVGTRVLYPVEGLRAWIAKHSQGGLGENGAA